MAARYALYFAPLADRPLWEFGSAAIGWDAETATEHPARPPAPALAPGWAEATAEPRRYGFHATLKAPFALAEGTRAEDLLAAAEAFAAGPRPVPQLRLTVRILAGFVALVPEGPSAALDSLAAACVRDFDRFRRPLTPAERARRAPERLSPRQVEYLDRWGYPFVFEEFRFHMTLTGRLPPDAAEAASAALQAAHRQACGDRLTAVSTLAVFAQPDPAERFRILAAWPLRAG
jgi:putative phosphonate metabolism protein